MQLTDNSKLHACICYSEITKGFAMDTPSHSRHSLLVLRSSEGKYLIQQRSYTEEFFPLVWDFTGGHVDVNETPEEAAVREAGEELGLSFRVEDLTKLTEFPIHFASGRSLQVFVFGVCLDMTEKDICLDPEEVLDFRFVDFSVFFRLINTGDREQRLLNSIINYEAGFRKEVIRSTDVILEKDYPEYHLTLRPSTDADIPTLVELNRNEDQCKFCDGPLKEDDVRYIWSYISTMADCFLMEVDGKPVGDIHLQQMNLARVLRPCSGITTDPLTGKQSGSLPHVLPKLPDIRRIDISIGLPEYRERKVGTRSIGLLLEYAFTGTPAEAVYYICDKDNVRSCRAAESNGFQLDPVMTAAITARDAESTNSDESNLTEIYYRLNREDYLAQTK